MEGLDLFMGVVAPYINFLIFFFLAIKFFKKPIQNMIGGKRDDYLKMLEESQKAFKEAQAQKAEYEQKLGNLQKELDQIESSIKESARLEAEELLSSSKRLAEHIVIEAKAVAENQIKQAQKQVRDEILRTATEKVAERIRHEVKEEQHLTMVNARVNQLNSVRVEA